MRSSAFAGHVRAMAISTPKKALSNLERLRESVERSFMALVMSTATLGSKRGPAPLTTPAATTRSSSAAAHTAAWGPPPETPMTEKRSMPRWSASSTTSDGQSSRRRPGWKVLSPNPGRSGAINRTPARPTAASLIANCSREPGVPWNPKIGQPSGVPSSSQPRSLPPDRVMTCESFKLATLPSSAIVQHLAICDVPRRQLQDGCLFVLLVRTAAVPSS